MKAYSLGWVVFVILRACTLAKVPKGSEKRNKIAMTIEIKWFVSHRPRSREIGSVKWKKKTTEKK